MHPMALAVKAHSANNPKWHEAMNGPNADRFWCAMEVEMDLLMKEMDFWEAVNQQSDMNVLYSMWAFKVK